MRKNQIILALSVSAGLSSVSSSTLAKVDSAEAAKLGKELTCLGGEAASNADNTIPAFSGKWLGTPPGSMPFPVEIDSTNMTVAPVVAGDGRQQRVLG